MGGGLFGRGLNMSSDFTNANSLSTLDVVGEGSLQETMTIVG